MKIAIVVLTYNAVSTGRGPLLQRTLETLNVGHPLLLIDNGSDDPATLELMRRLGATRNTFTTTIGGGMNFGFTAAMHLDPDVVVFSNDDMEWKPGWDDELEDFWSAAPENIGICTGLFERKVWDWNQPVAAAELIGGVPVLERETVPAAAWTFRSEMWSEIRPVPAERNSWGDVPVCHRLRSRGFRLLGADWARHLGDDLSLWGNESHLYGEPLDEAAWGLSESGVVDAS